MSSRGCNRSQQRLQPHAAATCSRGGTHARTRALALAPLQVALSAVPSKREFLQRLGPHVAHEVTALELRDHAEVVKEITEVLRRLFGDLDLEDTRKV